MDAAELIDDLANQRMLGPQRGEPAVERDALVNVLVALARSASEVPGVESIDLNPLIIAEGHPVAVDALIEIDDESRVT